MNNPRSTKGRHSFSIEINTKEHVNSVSFSNEPNGKAIFEGELGEIVHIELIEGILLKITGDNGVLHIDLTEKELTRALSKKTKESHDS